MPRDEFHISDEELLQSADGELSARRNAEIQIHLAECWTCRTRMGEVNSAIAGYIQAHRRRMDPILPPPEGARALLKLRMAELTPEPQGIRRNLAVTFAAVTIVAAGLIVLIGALAKERKDQSTLTAQIVPNPSLTPGATLPVTRNEVCAEASVETVRIVPVSVARQVFASYGIREPQPRAYELDYLVTPALGGGDNIRNFWPQPYGATVWNAHVKDALEDHLHRLVCSGDLDLATAQRDIARDWTAAYRKYFMTDKPLPQHSRFVKDRPWE
jgi:anti-sigma factor RsiW